MYIYMRNDIIYFTEYTDQCNRYQANYSKILWWNIKYELWHNIIGMYQMTEGLTGMPDNGGKWRLLLQLPKYNFYKNQNWQFLSNKIYY